MNNSAQYPKYNFTNAKSMMDLFYELDIQRDDFSELAYFAWKDIGNKYGSTHIYTGVVGVDNKLVIPDNVEYIESVNYPYYFSDFLINNSIFIYVNGSRILTNKDEEWNTYIDGSKRDVRGGNISYELESDNVISFPQGNFAGRKISVLYHGLLVDEDCDPLLYYKEVKAIAHWVAFLIHKKRASGGNVIAANMLPQVVKDAEKAMAAARIPEELTQNELDQIMNVRTSMDRKVYNSNYKFK